MEEKKFNFKMVKSIIKLGIILIIIIAVVLPIMVYSVLKNDNRKMNLKLFKKKTH